MKVWDKADKQAKIGLLMILSVMLIIATYSMLHG